MSKRCKQTNKFERSDSQSDDSRSRSRSTSRNERKNKQGSRSPKSSQDHDSVSIYIGNIDYNATEDELRDTFIDCGDIVRVTIIKNMKTGHPKGAAFIEFTDKHGVEAAMNLDGKHVRGRPLIVTTKKPRPENRDREARSSYYDRSSYDRRPPARTAPMYSSYPSSRLPYPPASRNGYHPEPRDVYDSRRPPSHIQLQMEHAHMQSRYDPYRRPDYYDPYALASRGSGMHPSNFYQNDPRADHRGDFRGGDPRNGDLRKMNEFRNEPRGFRDPRDMRQDFRFDSRDDLRGDPRSDQRGEFRVNSRAEQRSNREQRSPIPAQRHSASHRR